jgi:RNA polymerase sigma-70 factor (ECF subfamily)
MESGIKERCVEPPLADWTHRLAEGDEQAWVWFHERYYLSLLRYAAHCSGNPSAATEVVQQAYMRIARHAKPFADAAAFWAWLCCVVRCAAADHGRQVKRRLVLLEKFAHWRALHSEYKAAWHPSANRASALTEEALAQLPGDEAALLRRKYCDGWSTAELAANLGTTPKAIENRLARLRDRLREIILRIQ